MNVTHNERVKLTAGYLNTAAGACLTAGVIAPTAAAIFGFGSSVLIVSPLTLAVGMATFLVMSIGLHAAARFVLKGLRP